MGGVGGGGRTMNSAHSSYSKLEGLACSGAMPTRNRSTCLQLLLYPSMYATGIEDMYSTVASPLYIQYACIWGGLSC
jgi:hypothetical protein